jgi:LL-diaminopimelate aminotransferase
VRIAARLGALPSLSTAAFDAQIARIRAQGVDVISLAPFDPDLPPPPKVVEALIEATQGAGHRHSSQRLQPALRAAIAHWYHGRFMASLNPQNQVLPLNGTKEGLGYMPWLVADPGDVVLVPDPGYRLYSLAASIAGAAVVHVPLLSEHDFLPDLKAIPAETAARARLFFLNYPNNPTAAVAPAQFYHDLVAFAKHYQIVVCQDMAVSEIMYDNFRTLSFLEIPGAIDVGVEFHSLSITFNMTGYRAGMAVGNAKLIEALANLKGVIGATLPSAIQRAAIAAYDTTPPEWFHQRNQIYQRRRDLVLATLERIGMRARKPKASPFIWASVPMGTTSEALATTLLNDTGVWIMPGSGFGARGEGYLRISLTVPDDRLEEAMRRLEGWSEHQRQSSAHVPETLEAPPEPEKEEQNGPLGT